MSAQDTVTSPTSAATAGGDLAHNAAVRRRQHIARDAIGALLLAGGGWWIIGSGTPATSPEAKASDPATVRISTDDMVNRSMADKEWMALSENQLTTH